MQKQLAKTSVDRILIQGLKNMNFSSFQGTIDWSLNQGVQGNLIHWKDIGYLINHRGSQRSMWCRDVYEINKATFVISWLELKGPGSYSGIAEYGTLYTAKSTCEQCCGSGSSRIRNLKHYRGYGSGNGSETFPSFDTDPDIDLKNSDKSDLDQKWNQYTTLLKMSFRSIGGYKSLSEK